jgi:hypothetical protein
MEELFLRFSHLSETIFDSLDNQSVANCKEVGKSWYFYLDTQKFLQSRIIKANIKKVDEAVKIVKDIYQFFQPWNPLQYYNFIEKDKRCAKEDAILEIFLGWYDGSKYLYEGRCIYNRDKVKFDD